MNSTKRRVVVMAVGITLAVALRSWRRNALCILGG